MVTRYSSFGLLLWALISLIYAPLLESMGWNPEHVYSAEELVQMAVTANPKLQVAWEQAEAANYDWRMAESYYYPQVGFTEEISYNVQRGSANVSLFGANSINTNNNNTAVSGITGPAAMWAPKAMSCTGATGATGAAIGTGITGITGATGTQRFRASVNQLSASYLLFDYGVRSGNLEAARENFFAAAYMGQQTLQDTIFNTLEGYYQYLGAVALREADALDYKDAQVAYDAAKARFDAGVVPKTAVLQFLSQLSAAKLALEQAEGSEATTLATLARTVGLPAYTPLKVVKLPLAALEHSVIPQIEELIELALSSRNDLAAAYNTYLSNRGAWLAARGEGWPTLTTESNWRHTNIFSRRPPSQSSEYFSVALTLNVNLYSGGYYLANASRARALAEASYSNYVDVNDATILNVVTAYYQFYTAVANLSSSRDYLSYAQENFDAIMASYRHGAASTVDVVTAEKTLSDARSQRVSAEVNWMNAVVNVAYTTGTLQQGYSSAGDHFSRNCSRYK